MVEDFKLLATSLNRCSWQYLGTNVIYHVRNHGHAFLSYRMVRPGGTHLPIGLGDGLIETFGLD